MLANIAFSLIALMIVANICGDLIMRIRLTRLRPPEDRLYWWSHGGDEMEQAYLQLYPGTYLVLIRHLAFWLVIVAALVLLIVLRTR